MNKLKNITVILLLMCLCACQARFGNISILDDIKVSDISSIYLKRNDSDLSEGYLVENDETVVINVLKKLNKNNLYEVIDINDFDYSLTIETLDSNYEISFYQIEDTSYININGTWYENKNIVKINQTIENATYIK